MAQGQFTKEEADVAVECVKEILEQVPKTKRPGIIGELNDLYLFIGAAKQAAPSQADFDQALTAQEGMAKK